MTTGLEAKIRALLMGEWDPIGIRDEAAARDEYDDYIPHVASMIVSKKSPNEVAHYLLSVETGKMGLPGDAERARAVANRLSALR